MAGMKSFTLGGSRGMHPQEILVILNFGVLRHTEAHYHHNLLSYWNWKPSPSART